MKAVSVLCLPPFLFAFLFSLAGAAAQQPAPALLFSTYLGGSDRDEARSLAVDASGTIHVAGFTDSADFPVVGGLGNPAQEGPEVRDAFFSRLAPDGGLIFSTYFDEARHDQAEDVALGPAGLAYVAGWWGGFDSDLALKRVQGGTVSGDLLRVHGDREDTAEVVAVAPDGRVHLAGTTCSFYIFGIHRTPRPVCEGFLVTWAEGLGIERVRLLGFSSIRDMVVDAAGNLYAAGATRFIAQLLVLKLDSSGNLVYSVHLEGTAENGEEEAFAIDVDAAGNAYVTGSTNSDDFPVVGGVQGSLAGDSDAFVIKLDPSGDLLYSTYLGGAGFDRGQGIAVEPSGRVTVTGTTRSPDFPRRNPLPGPCSGLCGGSDAFVARLDPSGSELAFSTFLGGSGEDEAHGLGLDPQGNAVVAGWTSSADFPTVHAVQPDLAGSSDAFVAKIGSNPPDCSGATASPSVIWPPNGKMVPVSIQGLADGLTVEITAITQDEPGAAFSGIGSSTARVKAERDGKGDGRVYRVLFTASDPSGASCAGEVAVCVPHDRGKGSCEGGRR